MTDTTKNYVYMLTDKDDEKINKLGEDGWEIVCQNPIIISKDFKAKVDSSIAKFAMRCVEGFANEDQANVKKLRKMGFKFRKVYDDDKAKHLFKCEQEGAVLDWRMEFVYAEENALAYLTFGPYNMNSPALVNAEVIDANVPKEMLDTFVSCGAFTKVEAEEN